MPGPTRLFYQYSGIHSLLIGLLPFFLPALLWQSGLSLSKISWFIALNGVGYLLTLYLWDRLRVRYGWKWIIIISFLLELIVVGVIVLDRSFAAIYLIALLNGAYGCFFWMSQRLMFVHCTDSSNTGKQFGNFQMVVIVLLKIGILVGGFMWQRLGAGSVFIATLCLVIPAVIYYINSSLPDALSHSAEQPVSIMSVLNYRDDNHSLAVFFADGLFLFAESYFWLITLYLIAGQNLLALGILVVALSVLLAGVFYIIKNRLDRMNQQRAYTIAIVAYALSWLLRGIIDADGDPLWVYPGVVLIAFFTAFFRLAFNKRFFDLSRKTATHQYLALKSYYSQSGVAVLFCFTGLGFFYMSEPLTALQIFYWLLIPLSLVYLLYQSAPLLPNLNIKSGHLD